MITSLVTEVQTNQSLADASTRLLYSSALVLTLSMLAFIVDLAKSQVRREAYHGAVDPIAADASESVETGRAETKAAKESGDVAVLTRPRTEIGDGSGDVGVAAEPRRPWAGMGMSLAWLGTALLIAAVVTRGLSVRRAPLGNMYEFALMGASFAMVAFLLWSLVRDVRWLGTFITLPIVLTEMIAAMVFYTDASQLMPSLKSYWLIIHVTVATLSIGIFTIGFSLTILYLAQRWREEHPGSTRGQFMKALPTAKRLDQLSYNTHIIAFPLWTFTVIAGAIWAQVAWGRYWGWDPKEVWSFVIWVVYAAYLHARVTAGWRSKRSAYIALLGFACILINYGIVNVFFVGKHSYSGI